MVKIWLKLKFKLKFNSDKIIMPFCHRAATAVCNFAEGHICDPTQVNEADVVRGQIVILLPMYSTGIKDHFDTKVFLIPFSIPKI